MRGSSDVPATNVFVGVDHETMELVTRTVVGPAPPPVSKNAPYRILQATGPACNARMPLHTRP